MNRTASIVLLIVGVALLAFGWDAYRSVSSEVSKIFTGSPSNRAVALLVSGGLVTAAGLRGLSRR